MTIHGTAINRRPILISPSYGAGWSTWCADEYAHVVLTYQPIIDAVEAGETLTEQHPACQKLAEDIAAQYGGDFYFGGLRDLTVVYVEGDFTVEEYDGSESVTHLGNIDRVVV